jgi:uncharacterized LabA/DUF88 family protein
MFSTIAKTIIFIDGENLTYRFQDMMAAGKNPKPTILHEADTFVWIPEIVNYSAWRLTRVSYYTSIVGDDVRLQQLAEKMAAIRYDYHEGFGFLNPHIFKKRKRGDKTKSVDINLVTDLLRYTYNNSVDEVCVLTGDGDYLPTIHEVMRQGVRVNVGAFSSGLDVRLRTQSDEFIDLDLMCFAAEPQANIESQLTGPASGESGE